MIRLKKALFALFLAFGVAGYHSNSLAVSFKQTARRYPNPHEVISLLQQKFPNATPGNCQFLEENNAVSLGVSDPALGTPKNIEPTTAFEFWFSHCVSMMIYSFLSGDIRQRMTEMGAEGVFTKIASRQTSTLGNSNFVAYEIWKYFSPELQKEVAAALVLHMIGGGEVIEGYLRSAGIQVQGPDQAFALYVERLVSTLASLPSASDIEEIEKLLSIRVKNLNLSDAIKVLLYFLAMDDAFLRV